MGREIDAFDLADYVGVWLMDDLDEIVKARVSTDLDNFVEECSADFESVAPTSIGGQFIKFNRVWLFSQLLPLLKGEKFLKHFFEKWASIEYHDYAGLEYVMNRVLMESQTRIGRIIKDVPEWKKKEKGIKKLLRDSKKVKEVMVG